jgi:hypothetical protein
VSLEDHSRDLRRHRWTDASATFFITVVKALVDLPEQWDASSASCGDLVTDPWPLIYD